MKIINDTQLNYQTIGQLIDRIMEYPEDTHYYGKLEEYQFILLVNNKRVVVTVFVRYLKRYCEFTFTDEIKKRGNKNG